MTEKKESKHIKLNLKTLVGVDINDLKEWM